MWLGTVPCRHMDAYETTTTWSALAARVGSAQQLLVVTHRKPDGDAAGSCLGLARALPQPVAVHLVGPVGANVQQLIRASDDVCISDADPEHEPDLIVLVDTGAWVQVGPLADWLRARRDRVVGLDHHPTGNDIAPDRIIDPSMASATMMVLRLLDELEIEVDDAGGVAEALFAGLATDTGWFRHSNADAAAFTMAGRLVGAGVDRDRLYAMFEENGSVAKLKLQSRALGSLDLTGDGRHAIMTLTDEDFQASGASRAELDGLVNQPLAIEEVVASFLLYTEEDGVTKISLRSKPPLPGRDTLDVSAVASRLGGGGHVRASGARVTGPLPAAREKLLSAIAEVMDADG